MSKWLPQSVLENRGNAGYERAPLKDTAAVKTTYDAAAAVSITAVPAPTDGVAAAAVDAAASKEIPVYHLFNWSNLMFNWYEPQICLGESRKIRKDDLLPLNAHLKSEEVFKTFKQCWALEALKCSVDESGFVTTSTVRPKVELWRVMHSLIFKEFWVGGACRLVSDALVVMGSVWIKQLVGAVQRRDTTMALFYAVMMFVNSTVQTFALQQFIHGSFMSGSRVVTAATTVVFHATLCLRTHKMDPPKSVGEINNIQSKDANSLRDFVVFFHNLWACPLQIVMSVALLIYMLGFAGVVSVLLLALLVPVERAIGHRARAARKAVLSFSDERMKVINEMIDGIWTVKLTNLCPYVYEKISALRSDELAAAWHSGLIDIVNLVVTRSATLVITLLTFVTYVLLSGSESLSSDRAFASLAIIAILGRPMQVLPKVREPTHHTTHVPVKPKNSHSNRYSPPRSRAVRVHVGGCPRVGRPHRGAHPRG